MTDIINKIVWQTADDDKSWLYALCPALGVNMVSFHVEGGYHALDGMDRATTPAERAEVARRLVASWNACVGLTTEQIDLLADHCDDLKAQRDQTQAQRDQLLKALDRIAKWDQHTTEFALDWGSRGVSDLYRGIARDAIAACQPAPPVVHLPADDTEGGDL